MSDDLTETPDGAPVRTGVEDVDDALDAVESLAQRPIEEHVAVFERAHEQLRRALDAHDAAADPS